MASISFKFGGLRLRDPNIANRCKIAYNPSLFVVYFYILGRLTSLTQASQVSILQSFTPATLDNYPLTIPSCQFFC